MSRVNDQRTALEILQDNGRRKTRYVVRERTTVAYALFDVPAAGWDAFSWEEWNVLVVPLPGSDETGSEWLARCDGEGLPFNEVTA